MKLVGIIIGLVVTATAAEAQSLARVAAEEKARRQAIEQPATVYTNADLKDARRVTAVDAPPSPAEEETETPTGEETEAPTTEEGEPESEEPAQDEQYWRGRIGEARAQLTRARLFSEALQSRINALTTDFTARDDPAQRAIIEQDRVEALSELERVHLEIEEREAEIREIEEEARRAGAPPGWLR